MIVRDPTPDEVMLLWPPRPIEWRGPHRVLDLAEQIELCHLLATKQETAERLAHRYGISVRTVWRYRRRYAPVAKVDEPTFRAIKEWAADRGIPVSFDDAALLVHRLRNRSARAA